MNHDLARLETLSAGTSSDPFERARLAVAGRMPELDGLRGLAILFVVWHNAGLTWYHHRPGFLAELFSISANMGWVGVQLFFVLSGFLITGILLDEKGRSRQLFKFYMRRALRILPLYYSVLLLAFVVLPLLGAAPAWLDQDRARQVWYWTFLINWAAPVIGGGDTLAHFWSLAVEEQFYLLWPLLVVFMRRSALFWSCLGLIATAVILREWLIVRDAEFAQEAAYQFTAARWDALATGGLLALALRQRALFDRLARWSVLAVCAVLGYMVLAIALFHNYAAVEPGIAAMNQTVVALLFALLIFFALAQDPDRVVPRCLRLAPLRKAGKYSYAIYVFHVPMIHVWGSLRAALPGWSSAPSLLMVLADIAAVFTLSAALALVSWRFLEAPLLRLKRFF